MKAAFKLTQLNTRDGGLNLTCEDKFGKSFKVIYESDEGTINGLWNLCKGDWSNPKMVIVKFTKKDENGLPINPSVDRIEYV